MSDTKQPGEWLCLRWDGRPEWWAVRGHDQDDAALDMAHDGRFVAWKLLQVMCARADIAMPDEPRPERADCRTSNMWARWEVCMTEDGPGRTLSIYTEKGRGCFPVTVAEVTRG